MKKPPSSDELEFVWAYVEWGTKDGESLASFYPHRVIKRAKRTVYVEVPRFTEDGWKRLCEAVAQHGWWTVTLPRIIPVSRAKLESEEGVRVRDYVISGILFSTRERAEEYDRKTRVEDMYQFAGEWRSKPVREKSRSEHLKIFGLTANATKDQIKAAYREAAKRCHPDAGGSDTAFRRIEVAYRKVAWWLH